MLAVTINLIRRGAETHDGNPISRPRPRRGRADDLRHAQGAVAIDGEAEHSPVTTALIRDPAIPGLDVRLAFGRVRDQGLETTDHHQEGLWLAGW